MTKNHSASLSPMKTCYLLISASLQKRANPPYLPKKSHLGHKDALLISPPRHCLLANVYSLPDLFILKDSLLFIFSSSFVLSISSDCFFRSLYFSYLHFLNLLRVICRCEKASGSFSTVFD